MAKIKLVDAAKFFKQESHQLAAWNWLEEQLPAATLDEFAELYRAAPAIKEQLPPAWLSTSLKLIREFEGCNLEAYKDATGIPTIGWGSTRLKHGPVRMGDTITQQQADELLASEVRDLFGPGVQQLLPLSKSWRPEQLAALISFAYNLGLGALEESTLRKRLLAGEEPNKVVREELPKWVHAGEAVLPGLERRRAAEVAMFCGAPRLSSPPQQVTYPNPLRVPYYSQRDSQVAGQASRMCFSSSCAMLTAFLRPGSITGPNADDAYLKRVEQFGDSTDAQAQIKALASYGITAKFVQNADWADIDRQIARGVPVPCGFLHHGPSTAPTGNGHWLIVIGVTPTAVIVNDPWGDMIVNTGAYASNRGSGLAYSKKNWGPRWLVEGPGTGWAIIANP